MSYGSQCTPPAPGLDGGTRGTTATRPARNCQKAASAARTAAAGALAAWLAGQVNAARLARHTAELYDACRRQHLPMEEVALFEIASPDQEIPLGPMAFV